jgi:opacity protein-like surface antigen
MTHRTDNPAALPRAALVLAFVLCGAGFARAADVSTLDDEILRGSYAPPPAPLPAPAPRLDWGGFYFGGQLGYSSATVNYGDGLHAITNDLTKNLAVGSDIGSLVTLGNDTAHHAGFGGFIGYNFPIDEDLILGAEVNYSMVNLSSSTTGSTNVLIHNDASAPAGHHFFYNTTLTGNASVRIKDYAALRMRAGWAVEQFLPYAFVGGVVGRADYSVSGHLQFQETDIPDVTNPPTTPLTFAFFDRSKTDSKTDAIAYGATAGLGLEVALLPNVFLRAEWEYVYFAPIHDIQVSINSGHVGLGLKF